MVSFQCDGCADTVKKPQLDKHRQRCWASFTCLDCSTTFRNQEYKNHTSCISEAEKYQGALYKGPKKNAGVPAPALASTSNSESPAPTPTPASIPAPPAIHPSRLNQLQLPSEPAYTPKVQSYPVRGGGGRFGRGGGRGGGFASGGGAGGGGGMRYSATGENTKAPEGGMRSWGSAANSDAGEGSVNGTPSSTPAPPSRYPSATLNQNGHNNKIVFGDEPKSTPAVVATEPITTSGNGISNGNGEPATTKKNKNKKKGDKKGTGSRANTRNPPRSSTNGGSPPPATSVETIITTPAEQQSKTPSAVVSANPITSSSSGNIPIPTFTGPATTTKTSEKSSSSKKRKLETDVAVVESSLSALRSEASSTTVTATVPEKTIKRVKKNLSKLSSDKKSAEGDSLTLADWLVQVGKNKEKSIEVDQVLNSLKVSLIDGTWQLGV